MMTPILVGIGGSAGAIETLRLLLPTLPARDDIAYAIVLHRQASEEDARLARVLHGFSSVPVLKAQDGQPLRGGQALLCPADVHLAVNEGHVSLLTTPKENHSRPAIDVTFRSIANAYRERGCAIVLSGLLDDGTAGTAEIVAHGGIVIAQDPDEALFGDMPRHAIAAGAKPAPITEIATIIARFAATPGPTTLRTRKAEQQEELTRYTCPDCNGVMAEVKTGNHRFFRCRVGHAFSPETLHAQKEAVIENALWTALQILEEQADLTERAARRARSTGNVELADRMQGQVASMKQRAATVRDALPTTREAIEQSDIRHGV